MRASRRSAPRLRRGWRDERGLVTTELVLLFPLLILITFVPLHVAFFWHAKQVAELAAGEALDLAVVEGSDDAVAKDLAEQLLLQTGQVTDPIVQIQRPSIDRVEVTVSARQRFRVFPGAWKLTVRSEGRVERFLSDSER